MSELKEQCEPSTEEIEQLLDTPQIAKDELIIRYKEALVKLEYLVNKGANPISLSTKCTLFSIINLLIDRKKKGEDINKETKKHAFSILKSIEESHYKKLADGDKKLVKETSAITGGKEVTETPNEGNQHNTRSLADILKDIRRELEDGELNNNKY